MKSLHRIVPVSMCVASMLAVTGCDRTDTTATNVKAASHSSTAVKPAADVESATPTPVTTDDGAATMLRKVEEPEQAVRPASPPTPVSTTQIVIADPAIVDLGDIPTHDSATGKVRLRNTGSQPMTVLSARPSCGCTAMKFTANTIIPAQEEIEVEVQMTGGPRPGPLAGKTVTFLVEGQPEVVVQLKANAVSFVVQEPEFLDPQVQTAGTFKLRSIDDQPFKIMSVHPQVIDDVDTTEAKVEHELTVSWDKYREAGISRQIMIHLDHPKCQQVMVACNFKPEDYAQNQADMQRKREQLKGAVAGVESHDVASQPVIDPDVLLANMIKEGRNVELLQRLQSGLEVDHRDQTGLTLLGMAAKSGNVELVRALLNAKADLNATDNVGRTPLMHAATSKNVEAIHALLDAGANPTTRDNLGTTALSWAAWLGDKECVRALLEAGSDVEVVGTITGWTPLMLAAAFGDPGAIDLLVDAHANVEAADMLEGATPLIHAARTGKVDSIKALLKRGAELENIDRNGNTAFLACARTSGGDVDKLKTLIEAGANIHAKDNGGRNALELAQKRTDIRAPEVITLLESLLGSAKHE